MVILLQWLVAWIVLSVGLVWAGSAILERVPWRAPVVVVVMLLGVIAPWPRLGLELQPGVTPTRHAYFFRVGRVLLPLNSSGPMPELDLRPVLQLWVPMMGALALFLAENRNRSRE